MIIYLACPYWHEDKKIRRSRFQSANIAAAELMEDGYVVFSPLSHSVPISKYTGDQDHNFWMRQDLPMLELCDEMWILPLDGWK